MQGRLAFCLRLGVLCSALFACSADDTTGPADPGPEPPLPTAVRWSNPAAWPDGQVPVAGAAVTIPPGPHDPARREPAAAREPFTSTAPSCSTRRTSPSPPGWIAVLGTLRVGTTAEPFQHRATITLTGSPDAPSVMGMGNRVLGVNGGTLDLHGEARVGWTRLAATRHGRRDAASARRAPDWRAGRQAGRGLDRLRSHSRRSRDGRRAERGAVQLGAAAQVRALRRAADDRAAGPSTSGPRSGCSPATSCSRATAPRARPGSAATSWAWAGRSGSKAWSCTSWGRRGSWPAIRCTGT